MNRRSALKRVAGSPREAGDIDSRKPPEFPDPGIHVFHIAESVGGIDNYGADVAFRVCGTRLTRPECLGIGSNFDLHGYAGMPEA